MYAHQTDANAELYCLEINLWNVWCFLAQVKLQYSSPVGRARPLVVQSVGMVLLPPRSTTRKNNASLKFRQDSGERVD